MRPQKYIIALLILLIPWATRAQEATRVYESAQEAYELGLFQKADSLLTGSANSFKGETRIGVYRLLALCNLNMDRPEVAQTWVSKLLAVDPYYSVYNDAPRFAEMVNRIKAGKTATITTASQQAESIEEAPVPVTLITEEMIRSVGARTLKEALIAYVPGMTDIACNEEMNVAMRGIYSSGQEKLLIMLNGHRLNSYSTNAASPDFSISLEKVKQIEVLRGPASSLYGGVALTGVVNLITKEGSDVDGFLAKFSGGNYGQLRGDILFGKRYLSLDILSWASLYNATGQKVHYGNNWDEQPYSVMPIEGDMIIGGYNKTPSYDLGVSLKWDKFHLLYNRRFSKTVAPMSLSYFFTPYSYNEYRYINNHAPGYAISSQHAEMGYEDNYGKFAWQATVFFDSQNQQRYQVGGDEIPEVGANDVHPNGAEEITLKLYNGVFQSANWNEYTYGVSAQGSYNYNFGQNHTGIIMVGGHANRFNLSDASYLEGRDFDVILKTFNDGKVLYTGKETSADAYVQVKHTWKELVLNAGLRYDYKSRSNGKVMNVLSPRIALIYSRPKWSAKLSYSKSFVDSPYFYRNNTFDINSGDADLSPEFLNSWQMSFYSDSKIVPGLKLELNGFVNKADDFIIQSEVGNTNAGSLTNAGVEIVAGYTFSRFMVDGNVTWQRVLNAHNYSIINHSVYNVPDWQANLTASYEVLKGLKLNAHANFISKQYSQYSLPGTDPLDIDIPARVLFDLGASYHIWKVEMGINVYNIANTSYKQGGSSVAPMQQAGRWILGHVAIKF
jgi:iron complex outermembrane receptor protein